MWYFVQNGTRTGPCNNSQIVHFIQAGTISAATKVWEPGMKEWKKAAETNLSGHFISQPAQGNIVKHKTPTNVTIITQNIFSTLSTLKLLFQNPAGNIHIAFSSLSRQQAIKVSIIILFITSIASVLAVGQLLPDFFSQLNINPDTATLFKLSLLVPGSVFLVSAALCSVIRNKFDFVSELFIASIFNIPMGIFLVIASLLTLVNLETIVILFSFFNVLSIILLYIGCVKICGLTEKKALYIVPLILILSIWMTTVLYRAII